MNAMLAGAAGARYGKGQQSCTAPVPVDTFTGVAGRTAADSRPGYLATPQARAGAPNIIYIVLDDVGFSDLHCYGGETATPNMDALAAGGLQYTNFHCKAICSPSRASLLTGRNNHSVGMRDLAGRDQGYPHSRGRVSPAAATVAQILSSSGYSTMGVGKWHLTPDLTEGGSRVYWPLAKGFDRWYGFLSGWTDQYHPDLIEDNHHVERPGNPDYHFSVDIIDRAIRMIDDHYHSTRSGGEFGPGRRSGQGIGPAAGGRALPGGAAAAGDAGRPFFLYTAFGAAHAPVQVPREYIDKYVSTFEKGWDRIRQERYERQLQSGVIPRGTRLPARNPGDPAWDDMTSTQKKVYARFMAAYAGFIEHADVQVGRLVKYLKSQNQFDNTLIFLISDNGGAPEAGVGGSFERPYGGQMSVEEMYARLDDLGTENSEPLYQRPWAMASNTPFQYYKLWPHRGGVNTDLIASWPAGIRNHGLRRQFVDIIDLTPTALDVAGVQAPSMYGGVCQMPLHGKSIRSTFDSPDSPNPRDTQYFELRGNRAIRQGNWEAIAVHKPGTDFESDPWELYNVESDFSQAVNLASQNAAKLEELKKLWWSEAKKYGALPLLEIGGRGGGATRAQ
jgi:arylsulfatase